MGRMHHTTELPKQLRRPQESHPRKLLTAAHTYSHNWSRITSISGEPRQSKPPVLGTCPADAGDFEGDCRTRLRGDSHRRWDAGLSSGPLLPAAGLFLPATPCRELRENSPDPHLGAFPVRPSLSLRAGRRNDTPETAEGSKKLSRRFSESAPRRGRL